MFFNYSGKPWNDLFFFFCILSCSSYNSMFSASLDKSFNTVVDILICVGCWNLNSDSGFVLWYNWVGKSNNIHSCGKINALKFWNWKLEIIKQQQYKSTPCFNHCPNQLQDKSIQSKNISLSSSASGGTSSWLFSSLFKAVICCQKK